jgi:DNA topoisomerase VI subunit B
VRKFLDAQQVFMPGLRAYLLSSQSTSGNDDVISCPEAVLLNLPSSIPFTERANVCVSGIPEIENRLRYAQAMEALSGLRRQLRTRVMASKLNDKTASSQRAYV